MSQLAKYITVIAIALLASLFTRFSSSNSSTFSRFGSGQMFDQIAEHYDFGNELLSLGLHSSWKSDLIGEMKLKKSHRLLDIATGTADVAMSAASRHKCTVVGLDPSKHMLKVGLKKVEAANLTQLITLQEGEGENLAIFPSASFDRVTIAFGIRNFSDRLAALKEAHRVLSKKGGLLGILELSPPDESTVFGFFLKYAVKFLVPLIGRVASGSIQEYEYLERSIFDFPTDFHRVIESANFSLVKEKHYLGGLVKLFVASAKP